MTSGGVYLESAKDIKKALAVQEGKSLPRSDFV